MDEGINNLLLEELFESHGFFENIINEMKDNNVFFPYDRVIPMEEASYNISYDAISKMNDDLKKYNSIVNNNKEFFSGERKIYTKYIMLYIFSIIFIKIFAKTLSLEKIDEMWYALFGIALGSANVGLINRDINNYRYGTKENRKLMNELATLKEDYDENYVIARREISYMYSLNRNLENELPHKKELIKK